MAITLLLGIIMAINPDILRLLYSHNIGYAVIYGIILYVSVLNKTYIGISLIMLSILIHYILFIYTPQPTIDFYETSNSTFINSGIDRQSVEESLAAKPSNSLYAFTKQKDVELVPYNINIDKN